MSLSYLKHVICSLGKTVFWLIYILTHLFFKPQDYWRPVGEAKASGNLGNTLKVLGNFDEAIVCCQRHLDISRELNDKVMRKR